MRMAVIGYGVRIRHMLNEIAKADGSCKIAAIADPRWREIKDQLGQAAEGISFYETVDELLRDDDYDGCLIGTRCDLHTELAGKIIPTGKALFLEKPVSTNMSDLIALKDLNETYKHANERTVVSFPLRLSLLVQIAKEIIDSGKIGTVEHVQAVNNVPYGGVYYQNWYRDASIHGGLFLAKTTHDFDYLNYLIGSKPVRVAAMTSKQIFKGDKPAGLVCANCAEQADCPESPANLLRAGEERHGDFCVFAADTGNEDSGSALIEYDSGLHVSYSQNFFARKKAAARGARLLGYKGTVEFNWYTGEVKVFMHHSPRVETHKVEAEDLHHFGGDAALAAHFIDLMKGKGKSKSTLSDGIESALLCLKAIESARSGTFQRVEWP